MKTRVIVEIGSCHMGKLDYAKEAIHISKYMGADAIKFQLFPNIPKHTESGNVWLSPEAFLGLFKYAKQSGIDCSASVFDEDSFKRLKALSPKFIKFSYSQKDKTEWIEQCLEANIEPIVSCDIMTDRLVPKGATRLYCIPEYPVRYEVSFDEIFPRFHGFSDHTLGFRQTLAAVESGATVIEKHMRLDYPDVTCPDAAFAISPSSFQTMIQEIRALE